MKTVIAIFLTILSLATNSIAAGVEKLSVFAGIPPQRLFIERIGGEKVDVHIMLPPGQSPATYAPSKRELARLSGARVYFRIGVPFENALLTKIAKMGITLKIVDTRVGIEMRSLNTHHHNQRDHGKIGTDPHIWLDPKLVKIQARTICVALSREDPDNARFFAENLDVFLKELDDLDANLRAELTPLKGETLFVFHPAFGYFADAYGLRQVAVEIGGHTPSARQLARLIEKARAEKAGAIFVQPRFSTKSAKTVADAIGCAVVPIDPMADNYIDNMKNIASKIGAASRSRRGE